ncbi:MAG: hypothetical protein ABIG67_07045 [Pseudomonadota bacterium]
MTDPYPTLCFPDHEKSCFACCPPIRPAGYEHIQYRDILKRFLREDTESFKKRNGAIGPITGLSCWALGHMYNSFKQVGCMLHPAQNDGVDLRYRVDYGEKCSRETCREERIFSKLAKNDRVFWLHLADGLDAFSYSSRKINPLFNMINWGEYLLQSIASEQREWPLTKESLKRIYPFFSTSLSPKANVYLLNQLVGKEGVHLLKTDRFQTAFKTFVKNLIKKMKDFQFSRKDAPFTHRLNLSPDFLDFLRLSAHIRRITAEEAIILKGKVDQALERFRMEP